MLTEKKKNIDQAMSFKYWPARNDIKKNYVNPTFQNQLWFIDILTVTKINLCSSKTNQN